LENIDWRFAAYYLFITATIPAPSVRHVHSPWSLRSGGLGFTSEHRNGSAVGAGYLVCPLKRS